MKAAIIGCGGQGRQHALAYTQLPDIQVVACCDIVPEKAKALAQEIGATAFTDYTKMLSTVHPDLVSVCTLEGQHAAPAIAALQHRAHVLCEKMLAATLDEARAMVQTARQTQRLLATQFNYRHIPSVKWLKELLEAGTLGEPLLVVLHTHAYCHHHGIDLLRFLFGEIVAVQATIRGDRTEVPYRGWETGISDELLYIPSRAFGGILHFEHKLVGVLASSIHHRLDDFMLELHLLTSRGRLALRRMRRENICGELDTNLLLSELPPFPPPMPFDATFALSVHHFVRAVQGKPAVLATGEDGLRAMEVEWALRQASQRGETIQLPPTIFV